jgi:hypothetical protein
MYVRVKFRLYVKIFIKIKKDVPDHIDRSIDRSKSLDRLIDHIIHIKNNKRTKRMYICSIYQSIEIFFSIFISQENNLN